LGEIAASAFGAGSGRPEKALTRAAVALAVGESRQTREHDALLQRRDRIVTLIEGRAARVGETVAYVDF
jgi:hypothetical protein